MANVLIDSYLPEINPVTIREMLTGVVPGCRVRIDFPMTVVQMQMVLDILAERGVPASDVTFAVGGEPVRHGPSALVLKSRQTVEGITKFCDSYKLGGSFTPHDFAGSGEHTLHDFGKRGK